ncbi:MAG: hypothetical protein KDM64_09400 [Verrucomicrobiae bacterium]|nr:hypothetical protein [Verrucomicrobiae bacterium]MCB1090635.1 hypothetical protein [Verrucomicrobiae bacterium]
MQRIGVVDGRWEIGQAIALLRDDTARVWGEQYTSGKNGPRWPAPPVEAPQNVRKIAITRYRAATLCRDGRWYVWGGNEVEPGPYDLTHYATWGEIADIQSNREPFRVLTRDGKVYNLGGGRPLSTGLAAEGIEDLYADFLLPEGSPVWTWTTKKRSNAQAEVDALLMQIGTRPKDAWDLRIVGEEDASKVAAVWIEPVEESTETGTPVPIPSTPE